MRKFFLISGLLCSITFFGQDFNKNASQNNDAIESFMRLSLQQLYDTANYYYKQSSFDTSIICFNLFINATPKNADIEQQKLLIGAHNGMANIYSYLSDYRTAYDFLIKRLLICEKFNITEAKSSTYLNLGVIYHYLNRYKEAKQYYYKSLEFGANSNNIVLILNNLGNNELFLGNMDSAYYYINKSILFSEQQNEIYMDILLNSIANYYQKEKQYDSAIEHYHLSLHYSVINKRINVEATNLSNLGKLFFEINKIDSALYYIDLSNKIASENKFLKILADNYLTLSEIEKSKGMYQNALHLYETYTNLKDSIFNAGVFGSINLIQRQYEVSKTNQQIEELEIDRQIKENTIHYQKIILLIIMGVLVFVVFVLMFIMHQKRNLNKAYKALVTKNIEIVESQDDPSEANKKKHKKSARNYDKYSELLNNILIVMEDPKIFCDPEFSIDKLAELVQSNQKYVSEAINNILNKNFRSFLNSYRISEAQQLFSTRELEKFTIESIAHLVGFKSSKTFWETFKEITGVTPSYYLKSLQDMRNWESRSDNAK